MEVSTIRELTHIRSRPTAAYFGGGRTSGGGAASISANNLVISQIDFSEAVTDFHVQNMTGNIDNVTAEVGNNLAHLVRSGADDCGNLAVGVLAVFQRVQTVNVIMLDGVCVPARGRSEITNCVFDTNDFVLHFCTLTFFFRGVFTAPVVVTNSVFVGDIRVQLFNLSITGQFGLTTKEVRAILDTISNVKNPTMKTGDGMLHILLCDDDAIFTETLQRLIEAQPEFNRRYMQIECVHDPNALKKAAVQKADMIFLDIDMGDVNGIALARQIRTIRKDAVLIFVTNYGEYAAEGYEVSAFRFLPKLQLAEKLPDYFRQALAACRSRTRTLNVLCDGEGTNIVLDELVYVKTEERMLIFHRAEPAAPLKSRMSLRTLEEKLAEEGFLRTHNSFLVNMSYIAALQTSGVTLTTGQTLPVSLHGYKTIKTKYMAWRGRG